MIPPNGEKIVADYLRDHDDVLAILGDRRVTTKTPDSTVLPWVRYTQLDAPAVGNTHHLFEFYFQFDCYAGKDVEGEVHGQPEAGLLARTVVGALAELDGQNYQAEGGVVTGAQANIGRRDLDEDVEKARDRVIVTAQVWIHS